jgi:hypothetical protein
VRNGILIFKFNFFLNVVMVHLNQLLIRPIFMVRRIQYLPSISGRLMGGVHVLTVTPLDLSSRISPLAIPSGFGLMYCTPHRLTDQVRYPLTRQSKKTSVHEVQVRITWWTPQFYRPGRYVLCHGRNCPSAFACSQIYELFPTESTTRWIP